MLGLNSGLLGVRRVPTTDSASGLWVPNEQSLAKRAAIWPVRGGVYSQSSVYPGTSAASTANMTNGSFTDGTATGGGTQWVKIDYSSPVYIQTVVVGTATSNIPGGWSKSYTENADIQTSDNDSTWTTLFNTGSFASEGIYTFTSPASFTAVTARYIRITRSSYVALSEFYTS